MLRMVLTRSSPDISHAESAEDGLGVTMQFLRASEQGHFGSISTCLERYPHLKTLVTNPYDMGGNAWTRLQHVRDHAVEIAREHAVDELPKKWS